MTRFKHFLLLSLMSFQIQAVHLSKDGTGQVLIFPYYTVNGGHDTLINLTNTTDETKALRVRFREAANSREVFAFNVYLGAHDVWSGGVVNTEDGTPQIISFDQSCAFPNMSYGSNTKFYDDRFTGEMSDSYSDHTFRMNEGFVEVFEMGVMTGASAEAVIIEDNLVNNCSQIENAWNADGFWTADSETDMLPPTGGITGNITIINVSRGLASSQEPTAFENFSDVILNYNIDNDSPSLADSSLNAQIEYNGRILDTHWPTGYQAISALLMKNNISNEFVTTDAIGADTDWILTMPTRQYHIDSRYAQAPTPIAPFTVDNYSCEEYGIAYWNREEQSPLNHAPPFPIPVPPLNVPPPRLCFSANNIVFYDGDRNLISGSFGIFSSNFPKGFNSLTYDETGVVIETFHDVDNETYFDNGWMSLTFRQAEEHVENNQSITIGGLPVIGFAAQRYVNTSSQSKNYEGIFAHKYSKNIIHTEMPDEETSMYISQDNKGQVLLFPYYTVKNELNTLISIVNTSIDVKALKIRFLEGKNSRNVLDFNLYIAPYDVWTAGLVPHQSTIEGHLDEPSVKLITFDNSCTVPEISHQEFLPFAFSGIFNDDLGENLERSQEGSIEIFDMGTLGNAADMASATHNSSEEPSCTRLLANWTPPTGKWNQDPNDDIDAPTGGLYGSVSLIDIERGVDMTYDATAIVNFTTEVNQTAPGYIAPNLSTGNINRTLITTEEGIVKTNWESPINAVTALFMQSEVSNDYVVEPSMNARTNWVNFYPTRSFYTDSQHYDIIVDQSPFYQTLVEGCEDFLFESYNRDQQASLDEMIWPGTLPPGNYEAYHCWGVNTASVNNADAIDTILDSNLQMDYWERPNGFNSIYNIKFNSGWMKNIYDQGSLTGLGENGETHEIFGVPVLGFTAQRYINNNAQPGVIANYAVINKNKGKRKITITPAQ